MTADFPLFSGPKFSKGSLIRLFIVLFGTKTNKANKSRIEEFFEIAEAQLANTDYHISVAGDQIYNLLQKAISMRGNLHKTLLALKHYRQRGLSENSFLENIQSTIAHIAQFCQEAHPTLYLKLHKMAERAVEDTTVKSEKEFDSHIDVLARHRWHAQASYLNQNTQLRSIAEDFDQAHGIPYLLIDQLILN